jgi:predicted HicB family RNase H-like nuclease
MKNITSFLALVLCLSVTSCGESNPSSKFFAEWENLSTEMSAAISKDDVDGAKTIFDAKKEGLKSQCKVIGNMNYSDIEKKLIARRAERILGILEKAVAQQKKQSVTMNDLKSKTLDNMVGEFIDICSG